MAKPRRPAYTPNQIVALNLAHARTRRGWIQEQAAEHLEPYLGTRWSAATVSQVERSVAGGRIKQFSVDELVALSRAFDLPITWFLVPPRDEVRSGFAAADADQDGHDMDLLVQALIGSPDGRAEFEQALLAFSAEFGEPIMGIIEAIRDGRESELYRQLFLAFGDLAETRRAISRLGVVLDELLLAEKGRAVRDSPEPAGSRKESESDNTGHHEEPEGGAQ